VEVIENTQSAYWGAQTRLFFENHLRVVAVEIVALRAVSGPANGILGRAWAVHSRD